MQMTVDQFVDLARRSNTIFGVTFTKKTDGTLRNMTARMHVTKGVKGVIPAHVRREEDDRNNVLTVYDMQVVESTGSERGAFRRINLSALHSVSLKGERWVMDHNTGNLVFDRG